MCGVVNEQFCLGLCALVSVCARGGLLETVCTVCRCVHGGLCWALCALVSVCARGALLGTVCACFGLFPVAFARHCLRFVWFTARSIFSTKACLSDVSSSTFHAFDYCTLCPHSFLYNPFSSPCTVSLSSVFMLFLYLHTHTI